MRYPRAESNTLELKRELPRNDQVIKTAIGFCNTYGGTLIVGVADNREIIGLSETSMEQAMKVLDKAIFEACSPQIRPRIYAQRFGDKVVLVLEVSEGMNKPYFRHADGLEKGTFIRLGRHTLRATSEVINELNWESKGIDFERLPIFRATVDDLDLPSVEAFLESRKNYGGGGVNERILLSYNVLAYDQSRQYPSVLGMLLFGKKPQRYCSEAMIICSHFRGTSGRETVATVDCEGTLFDQFKQAYAFLSERLYRSFSIGDAAKDTANNLRVAKRLARHEQLEIPPVAIRETLLNMVVHRNYHTKSPSKVAIYDDRVEFFSPGQFPGPISVENLTSGITYLRNPGICKVLREAGYIEKLGSGFISIFESYEKAHLKKPYVIEEGDSVKCVLPRTREELIPARDDFILMMELFSRNNEVAVNDVVQVLSVSRPTAVRRLNKMREDLLIERIGKTKNVRYRLLKTSDLNGVFSSNRL